MPSKRKETSNPGQKDSTSSSSASFARKHFTLGWAGICLFITMGIFLEALHAMKISWYLGPEYSARRLMWTLAHVHGTLFSILLVVLGFTGEKLGMGRGEIKFQRASRFMQTGWVLVPAGFFLGGVQIFGGDPGWGIFLVPIGAMAMLIGAFYAFSGCRS